ncbi:type II secretion system F family protein [Lachnospiraceae bacterium OttesenSCG-928-J05]|nr:type II secretion system F family protein [Lachnospiraceae bacterium OttesenSCG-928-J05]
MVKEVGQKLTTFITPKSCWRQDISFKEYTLGILTAWGYTLAVAIIFYRSFWALLALTPLCFIRFRNWYSRTLDKKKSRFKQQFKDFVLTISANMSVGYSLENAVLRAGKELALLYEKPARIFTEISVIGHQLQLNIPIERAFLEMYERTQDEEVGNFTTCFVTAKRSGGNLVAIIDEISHQISEKEDVRKEIETILSAKKLEFSIMQGIPFFIIGYVQISFPGFNQVLFGNLLGTGVMTICLAIYLTAIYIGSKITNIEV